MSRHDFSEPDKKLLAQRVGYHCSNPACGVATIGPSDIPTDKEYVGVAAHIYSASIDNGPRANPNLTEKERRSPDNGIHLCNKCSTLIDKNKGAGYPAEVLLNWKRCAEAAAKDRIYQNTPANIFTRIDFSNLEEQYSTALTCTGLNEKNVLSCPTNREIILEVSKKLNLANKCVLAGSSGSGKSLLTYQIAYRFHQEGWSVFKTNKDSISNGMVLAAPTTKSLILVDDAQIIEIRNLENLLGSAYKDCIVLANLNTSREAGDDLTKRFPSVEIVPSSQIHMLKQFCLENKDEIAETLRSLGLKVQSNDFHSCIEARIERASREATPWLFNYCLTEGWNSAKLDIDLLRDDENQHLVLVTVAAFQYATLDFGVGEEVIINALRKFRNENDWLDKARRTIRSKCLTNEGKIRNKHYEYSRKILAIFVSKKDLRSDHNYLIELFKDILESGLYERGHSNILEFIMFNFKWCQYQLNNYGFIQKQAENLINCDTEVTPAKVNKLNSLIRVNSDIISLLKSRHNLIEDWIFSCSKDTAYPLGNLLNTLNNEKLGSLNSGASLFDNLLNMIMASDAEDRSRFSNLINRVYLLLNEEDRHYASAKLGRSGFSVDVSGYIASMACYHFSSVVNDFGVVNQSWSEQQVTDNVEAIDRLFNKDFNNALDYFKELIDHYFGIIGAILGCYNPTPTVKKHGREIARRLDESAIVQGFESINASEVQKYSNILVFLALYNKNKLKSISDQFNYDRLESLFFGASEIDHYHRAIVSILRNTESPNWKKHVSWVMDNVDYVERIFFLWDHELALERLRNGAHYKIKIHMCSDCESELIILKGIYDEEGCELVERIVLENKESLSKAICTKSKNGDDHKSKFDLLLFLFLKCDFIYREIFGIEENRKDVIDKVERLLRGKKWENMIAKLYLFLIKEYSPAIPTELSAVERRFPSVAKFNIKHHVCEE